ncbi:MAG: periplasmic heavy metal sensor [Acidobacteriota bacterium]|nr:periplasmic heavy metal sensor [Acidobacteriota bacterium]
MAAERSAAPAPDRPTTGIGRLSAGTGAPHLPPAAEIDPDPARAGRNGADGAPRHRIEAFRTVARFLDLDQAQRAEWKELLAQLRRQTAPLREEVHRARAALRAALDASEPDAATLGNLLLEAREKKTAIAAARRRYQEDFRRLLDGEQTRRLEAIDSAARLARLLPAFRATALIAPSPRRPRR